MRLLSHSLSVGTALLAAWSASATAVEVLSPDGQLTLAFEVRDLPGAPACPVYRLGWHGRPVVAESRLGLDLEGGPLRSGLQVIRQTESQQDTTWQPVYGERSVVRDRFNQLVVELSETAAPRRQLQLTLRAYNEGVAFCYTLPKQEGLERVVISKENSEFRFLADHAAWAVYSAQGRYTNVPLSQIKSGCERPLVLRVGDRGYAALAEARCVDYARTKFGPLAGHTNSLVSELAGSVTAGLPLRTPWRVIMLAESPGRLLENNDLLLNLNDPCALADTSWIKPGKVIREVTLSTRGARACVDFAAQHHLQYLEFDAGWYGPESARESDPRSVKVNPNRPQGPLDVPEVIRYAGDRGIGVLLYVNHVALERQLDEILPLYQRWGVKGIKYGFVNVGAQQWTQWLHEAIRKSAQYKLMVDVHDEYRPTGWTRTYPNLLTVEGIRGDEERQENSMNLTTLFTRMLAGSADITVCYFDQRVDQQATHAYQLAKAVCFYSPFQFLYWYDRPALARELGGRPARTPNVLGDEPELEFFDQVPTVWDDTKVLRGEIGQYALLARRSGPNWFLGAMNSDQPRAFEVPLTFLEPGRRYVAHVYSDDSSVPTRTHVKIERFAVQADTVLKVAMPARGGQALRLVPATDHDAYPVYPR